MAEGSEDGRQQRDFRRTERYFEAIGIYGTLPEAAERSGACGDLMRSSAVAGGGGRAGRLKVIGIDRGRITCLLFVTADITNVYNTLHGGAVAVLAEEVALACIRTVAGENNFFLGEGATTYLSPAKLDAEVEVYGHIVRQGRRVVVSSVEFRDKKTRKLLYTFRATFYNIPVSRL